MPDGVKLLARSVRDRIISEAEARDLLARLPEDLPLDPAEAITNLTPADWDAAEQALTDFRAGRGIQWPR